MPGAPCVEPGRSAAFPPTHAPLHGGPPTPSRSSCPPQTGIPVLGVVENMSGLRQPLAAFKFYGPDGADISEAVLAAAAAAAGGGGGADGST